MTRDLDELDLVDIRASLHAAMNAADPHKALANWALKHGEDLIAAWDDAFETGAQVAKIENGILTQ